MPRTRRGSSTQLSLTCSPNPCRFGAQLKSSLIKDYYYSYIAYDDLKASLKTPFETEPTAENPNPPRRPWTEDDERRFVRQLEQELDKVFTFQHVKSDDIIRRIKTSEKEVEEVIKKQTQANNPQSVGQVQPPSEEDFELLEADLSDIIADVHDLAKFTQLNYTGFQKIIKKHDVRHVNLILPARYPPLTVHRNLPPGI